MMEKTHEVIVAAACIVSGKLFIGVRHWDGAMNEQYKTAKEADHYLDMNDQKQGFYTNRYRYIDRVEGFELAKANGQLKYPVRNGCDKELYSEGLW